MVEVSHNIGSAIKELRVDYHEFFKAIMDRAFEKDPAMKERYLQVERDYDAAKNTALRKTEPHWERGPLPPDVFTIAAATSQTRKHPRWLSRARYLASEHRLEVRWFFLAGKWVRCVTIGVLSAAFAKYYPDDIVQ